jgi:hypothetical protein
MVAFYYTELSLPSQHQFCSTSMSIFSVSTAYSRYKQGEDKFSGIEGISISICLIYFNLLRMLHMSYFNLV